jgi:hypothetical protein
VSSDGIASTGDEGWAGVPSRGMTATVEQATQAPLTPGAGVAMALDRLDAIVRRALAAAEAAHGRPRDDPFRGLHLDAAEIARTLARRPGVPLFAATLDDLPELPCAAPQGSRLASLALAFGLSPFDVDALLVALGPELDLRYERLFAYLQDDVTRKRPTVNLALDLLCSSPEEKLTRRLHFSPSAPLVGQGLIEWLGDPQQPHPSLLANGYRPDAQIVRFLLDEAGLDPRLGRCARLVDPALSLEEAGLDPSTESRLCGLSERALGENEALTVCFHGDDEGARASAAHGLAKAARRRLLIVDASALDDPELLLPIAFREAQLQKAVLVVEGWEALRGASHPGGFRRLQSALIASAALVVLSGRERWMPSASGPKGVIALGFPKPAFPTRIACWLDGLVLATGQADPGLAQALAARFRLGGDQIWDAVLTARNLALGRSRETGASGVPEPADFFAAARAQSGHELATVATRIETAATWADIVLPDDALAQLREVCSRVSLGHRVMDDWGFARRLSHGKGVTALFSGPSGTGKTMAAEVIANELGMDLYRVEVPSVVSKWIGETEKNLEKVFRCAENTILFFDEADALFGKRSEVRDAHDRYANVEISYLLQRMETFDGLAILATNVRHHMDEAFLRRLAFVVQFPFPDDAQRREIWQRIWPAETPLGADLDFDRLARTFPLSGGNVKNIALAAAFSAAEREASVEMADVLHALRREYQKLGKNFTEGELAGATS